MQVNVAGSLALTPDESKLFVANAGNNDVAVFDVSNHGHSHALGFIPVGKYPTSVRVTPDGKELLVANGKGYGQAAGIIAEPSADPARARDLRGFVAKASVLR